MLDLSGLAKHRLEKLGVKNIYHSNYCTYSDPELFYSYRRDGETGRIASLIYINN
jgi:copper oxidase (laccase) domain-containing protein